MRQHDQRQALASRPRGSVRVGVDRGPVARRVVDRAHRGEQRRVERRAQLRELGQRVARRGVEVPSAGVVGIALGDQVAAAVVGALLDRHVLAAERPLELRLQHGRGRIEPHHPLAVVGEAHRQRLPVAVEIDLLDVPVGVLVDHRADFARRHVEAPQREVAVVARLEREALVAAGDQLHQVPLLVGVGGAARDHVERLVGALAVPHLGPIAVGAEADADHAGIIGDPFPHPRALLDPFAFGVAAVEPEAPDLRLAVRVELGRQQHEAARRIEIDHVVADRVERLRSDIGDFPAVELDHEQPRHRLAAIGRLARQRQRHQQPVAAGPFEPFELLARTERHAVEQLAAVDVEHAERLLLRVGHGVSHAAAVGRQLRRGAERAARGEGAGRDQRRRCFGSRGDRQERGRERGHDEGRHAGARARTSIGPSRPLRCHYRPTGARQADLAPVSSCAPRPRPLRARANSPTIRSQGKTPMAATRTFSIIKPDATRRNLTGAVTKMLEDAGLRVVASKRIHMSREQAEGFYAVHRERPFFGELVDFMLSGPVVVQVLEGDDAVKRNREVMGATNPADAAEGTDPQDVRRKHRGQHRPRLGQRRERRDRDRLLLQPEEIVG